MIYHGQVRGPAGQFYQCEHNHRTETAAITCANSSGTRRMAAMVWQRAAVQAAEEAALAKKKIEEREAAQARRIAAQEAAQARQAAARAAAKEAKAAKRAASLAAMTPQRAWDHMTPAERLLRTADTEMEIYGEIRSPDAQAAYGERAAKPPAPKVAAPESARPRTHKAISKSLKVTAVALTLTLVAAIVCAIVDVSFYLIDTIPGAFSPGLTLRQDLPDLFVIDGLIFLVFLAGGLVALIQHIKRQRS